MKIADASVAISARRSYSEKIEKRENLQVTVQPNGSGPLELRDPVTTSGAGLDELFDDKTKSSLMQTLKALLVEILTGHKIKVLDPADLKSGDNKGVSAENGSEADVSLSSRACSNAAMKSSASDGTSARPFWHVHPSPRQAFARRQAVRGHSRQRQ